MKIAHIKTGAFFFLAICMIFSTMAVADETEMQTGATLEMQNSVGLGAGYRYLDIDGGGETLRPYDYLDSSALGLLDFVFYFPWKGTLDFAADYSGDSYYQVNGEFNYRGDVDFWILSTRFPMNAEHLALPVADPGSFTLQDDNPDDTYTKDIGEDMVALKLRTPNYPAHFRLGIRQFTKTGDMQQIFADRNCTTRCHMISQTRALDQKTTQFETGADAHLGYVDASYNFKSTAFTDDEPNPEWTYGIISGNRFRPETLEHNVNPDIASQEHYVALSTSNTGRVAATAGYSLGRRENKDADLDQDYTAGSGSVVWRPMQSLCATMRYNIYRLENDTPAGASADLRTSGSQPLEFGATRQIYSGDVCYTPFRMLRLKGDYRHKTITRDEAEAWDLPEETTTDSWKLGAKVKPLQGLTLDVSYDNQQVDDPAHPTTLTDKNSLSAGLTWQPSPVMLLQCNVQSSTGENDEDTNRDETRQKIFGGVTLSFKLPVNAGLYYTLFEDEVTNDLTVASGDPVFFASPGASYQAGGSQILFQISATPFESLKITAGIIYLTADGLLSDIKTANFTDIGDFTEFDAAQSEFTLDIDYQIGAGLGIQTHFGYQDYQDKISGENDETVTEASALISKRW